MTTKKPQVDWRIVCTGILALVILEAVALFLGYNGTILSIVIAIIGCVIGVTIPLDKFVKH